MSWSEPTVINTAVMFYGVLVPFWFAMFLGQARWTTELPWSYSLKFAAVASPIAATICWVTLALLPMLFGWW